MTYPEMDSKIDSIVKAFDRELKKTYAPTLLHQIQKSFSQTAIPEGIIEDNTSTYPKYLKLKKILSRLYENYDEQVRRQALLYHRLFINTIPSNWIIQFGMSILTDENYILFRLGGTPKGYIEYESLDRPIFNS